MGENFSTKKFKIKFLISNACQLKKESNDKNIYNSILFHLDTLNHANMQHE